MKTSIMRGMLFVGAAVIALAAPVWGQQKSDTDIQYDAQRDKLVTNIAAIKNGPGSADEKAQQIRNEVKYTRQRDLFGIALARATASQLTKAREAFVQNIDNARVDKQVGGAPSNSGATSLLSKASVPGILGLAVENGALQKGTSGTTITFRGNPVGIIKALGDKGFIQSYDDDDSTTRVLRRFSFAISFDTSRGNQPGTFTGDSQQLSSYMLHYDIWNKRDPRNSSYRQRWENLIRNQGQAFTEKLGSLQDYFGAPSRLLNDEDQMTATNLQAWQTAAQDALIAATPDDVPRVVDEQLGPKLQAVRVGGNASALATAAVEIINSYLADRGRLLKEVANGPIVAFEYTNNRPGNQPNYSNFNLIGEFSPFNGRADLTANASFSTFSTKPTGVTRTSRDFQLSGQLDIPLGDIAKTGPFVFTMSGKYQHVFSDITTTGTTPTTLQKGNIGIGQFKFTIPVKGSGVKIPLSVTFSNRTEFIKESKVRGNIGVTFDLDTLFSKLKP